MTKVEVGDALLGQFGLELADCIIDVLELFGQGGAWGGVAVQVAAGQAGVVAEAGLCKLLADTDGLEVHAKDRGHAGMGGSRTVQAVDPIDDGVHLRGVVGLNARVAGGVVIAYRRTGELGVYFRRIQVVDAFTGRAAENLVGRVLVRPGGEATGFLDDLEDGVGAEILVGIDRLALAVNQFALHVVRVELGIDLTERAAAGNVGDEGGGEIVADVEFLEVGHFGALAAGASGVWQVLAGVGGLGRILRAVVAVVVEQARRFRRGASDLGDHAGIGVGRRGGEGVRVDDAGVGEFGEVAGGMVLDPVGEVYGMHAVHTDQQDVLVVIISEMKALEVCYYRKVCTNRHLIRLVRIVFHLFIMYQL